MYRISAILLGLCLAALPVAAEEVKAPVRVSIQKFKVIGSSVFDEWELANITQPYEDQLLTVQELQKVADAITRYYLDHGYLTSRAVLANQTIENGIAHIQVVEGSLESIEIRGNQRIQTAYIRDRIQSARQKPLNQEQLEHQLRLLQNDPLFKNVEASLKEGSSLGNSILTVRVTEANPTFATVRIDNEGSESVGSNLMTTMIGTRNLTGDSDLLFASYSRSTTGGVNLWNFNYQRSLNAQQGTLQFRIAPSRYRVTQSGLEDLGIRGSSNLYEATIRQPLSRQPQAEFALSLGVTHRTGTTLIADILTTENQTTVIRFGQDFLNRDRTGVWLGRSQFNFGAGQSGQFEQNIDRTFATWTGRLQRLQPIGKNHLVSAQFTWQITPDRLPLSQQFTFGGAQTLRGYAPQSFSGDNGVTFTLADQITIMRSKTGDSMLKLAPFIDVGTLWNHPKNPIQESNRFYTSAGLGVIWQPTSKWSVEIEAAFAFTPVNNSSNTALYFNSNYRF